ncbi:MAG: hypothetical protein AB7Q45_18125 [Planctomycetaceae bacterium]
MFERLRLGIRAGILTALPVIGAMAFSPLIVHGQESVAAPAQAAGGRPGRADAAKDAAKDAAAKAAADGAKPDDQKPKEGDAAKSEEKK